jgi:hypothetical protein
VPVSSIIGSACVFPDVDQGREPGNNSPGLRVVLVPIFLELCGGEEWKLPSIDLIPEPPEFDDDDEDEDEDEEDDDDNDDDDDDSDDDDDDDGDDDDDSSAANR